MGSVFSCLKGLSTSSREKTVGFERFGVLIPTNDGCISLSSPSVRKLVANTMTTTHKQGIEKERQRAQSTVGYRHVEILRLGKRASREHSRCSGT